MTEPQPGGVIAQLDQELRVWAKGTCTTEAAVELLIRGFAGRFASAEHPWILPNDKGGYSVDFESVPDNTRALSSEERAYLLTAASIGLGGSEGPTMNLSDTIVSLGRDQLILVLAGLAHASGSQEHSGIEIDPVDGTPSFTQHASVYPWPDQTSGLDR